jgi:hypothetical protein
MIGCSLVLPFSAIKESRYAYTNFNSINGVLYVYRILFYNFNRAKMNCFAEITCSLLAQ